MLYINMYFCFPETRLLPFFKNSYLIILWTTQDSIYKVEQPISSMIL